MKFVASINYSDEQDSYHIYHFNQDYPFVADSLEEAKKMVNQAVEANTKVYDSDFYDSMPIDEPIVIPTIFGMSFGEIQEGQTLHVEVMTLDDWFDKNQKAVDCKSD